MNLDYYDGGRLVHVPVPSPMPDGAPTAEDADDDEQDAEPCMICGLRPCDCDGIFDRWRERNW